MIQGFHSAAMGSKAQQRRIESIADNVANVNTTGFKSTRLDFKDAIYATMKKQVEGQDGNLELGHGVLVSSTTKYFRSGSIQNTDNPLDFAINGDAFFTTVDAFGEVKYSRNGSFSISAEANGNFLVNGNGEYVLSSNGNRINLGANPELVTATADGTISVDGQQIARLGMAKFANVDGLEGVGQTSFVPTVASGAAQVADNYSLRQGAVESSNVDMADEMSRLIRTQRAFSLAGKGITTADEMESIANNMRR